jgi:hypothetical protein
MGTVSAIVLSMLILAGTSVAAFKISERIFSGRSGDKGTPGNPWLVGPVPPADFRAIQEAVNNDSVLSGHTIAVMVNASTFYDETVSVNKTLAIGRWSGDAPGSYPIVGGFDVDAASVNISDIIVRGDIYLNSSNNLIVNNTADTIYIYFGSNNNTLAHNSLLQLTIYPPNWPYLEKLWDESAITHFVQNISESNTINRKPIYYWVNQHDKNITTAHAGYIAIVNSANITVENVSVEPNSSEGVLVVNSTDINVANVSLSIHYTGILAANSSRIVVRDLKYADPSFYLAGHGVVFTGVKNSYVKNNVFNLDRTGQWPTILLSYSQNNTIKGNTEYSWTGNFEMPMLLRLSDGNFITDNSITNTSPNFKGVGIELDQSLNNTVVANNVSGTLFGLGLDSSNGSMFYHNNIMNNSQPANITNSVNNRFDNGYEGNFWGADYSGNDTKGTGVGTPYHVGPGSDDNHPLMKAWSENRVYKRPMKKTGLLTKSQELYTFSNCTLGLEPELPRIAAGFTFNRTLPTAPTITLNVTCGYSGFLNITIQRNWIDGPFNVTVDVVPWNLSDYSLTVNKGFTSIYMAFNSSGTHTVKIIGSELGSITGNLNDDGIVDILDAIILSGTFGAEEPTG